MKKKAGKIIRSPNFEAELNDQIIFRIGQMCQNVFVLDCLRSIYIYIICRNLVWML